MKNEEAYSYSSKVYSDTSIERVKKQGDRKKSGKPITLTLILCLIAAALIVFFILYKNEIIFSDKHSARTEKQNSEENLADDSYVSDYELHDAAEEEVNKDQEYLSENPVLFEFGICSFYAPDYVDYSEDLNSIQLYVDNTKVFDIVAINAKKAENELSQYPDFKVLYQDNALWIVILHDISTEQYTDTDIDSVKDMIMESFRLEDLSTLSDSVKYVLPDSNSRYISEMDLEGLSPEALEIARNEIYARKGYIFETNQWVKEYFQDCDWYEGTVPAENFTTDRLNDFEYENAQFILEYEKEKNLL